MAIKIKGPGDRGVIGAVNGVAFRQEVRIYADTEAEITALPGVDGEVTDAYGVTVRLDEGSMAMTAADDAAVVYILLPGGWKKAG